MEAPQHIAAASEQSICDEASALLHLPIASARAGSADAQGRRAEVRDGGPHSPDELGCLWPLAPDTVLAEHMADNRSSRPGRRHALVNSCS